VVNVDVLFEVVKDMDARMLATMECVNKKLGRNTAHDGRL
jgi:hypothetical protein